VTINPNADAQGLYALLAEMAASGEAGVVATVIRTARSVPRHAGSKMVVRADGSVTGSVGGGAVEAKVIAEAELVKADGVCRRLSLGLSGEAGVCGGEVEVFLEPVSSAAPFWIFGAGHVGRALLEVGLALPFRFTIVDDRPEFLADLGPVQVRNLGPTEVPEILQPTANTVVLLASRNHELDGDFLEAIFAAEETAGQRVAFLGVVGSKTKARVLQKRFASDPARAERFREVQIPVGLAIGAETPQEIALSILAEILAEVRQVARIESEAGESLGVYRLRCRPGSGGESQGPP